MCYRVCDNSTENVSGLVTTPGEGTLVDLSGASAADMHRMIAAALDRANGNVSGSSQRSGPSASVMQLTSVAPLQVLPTSGFPANGNGPFGIPMSQQIFQHQHQQLPVIMLGGGGFLPSHHTLPGDAFIGTVSLPHATRTTPFLQTSRTNASPLILSQSIPSQDQVMAAGQPIQIIPQQQLQALLSNAFALRQTHPQNQVAFLHNISSDHHASHVFRVPETQPSKRGRGRASVPLSQQAGTSSDRVLKTIYTEISRLEGEVRSKQAAISQLQEEGRQLVRKEKLLKLQVNLLPALLLSEAHFLDQLLLTRNLLFRSQTVRELPSPTTLVPRG